MVSQILDGKKLASESEKEILESVLVLKEKGVIPTLATILVGDDPASETYVRMKQETCKRVGMESLAINLPKETSTEELLLKIDELNNNKNIHGILLQHPVPNQINERECFERISIEKDVDGVTCLGFGRMSMDLSAYGSCTPAGIMRILEFCDLPFEENCLRFYETERAVKTASSEQVRKPIYSSSVNLWRNYEHKLSDLIEILEPVLRELPQEDQPKSFVSH